MKLFTQVAAWLAAHFLKEQPLMDDQNTSGVSGGVIADAERVVTDVIGNMKGEAQKLAGEAQADTARVIGVAKSVFSVVEADALAVIGNLGHVRTILDGFNSTVEVAAAKAAIEQAIIAVAQHIGG